MTVKDILYDPSNAQVYFAAIQLGNDYYSSLLTAWDASKFGYHKKSVCTSLALKSGDGIRPCFAALTEKKFLLINLHAPHSDEDDVFTKIFEEKLPYLFDTEDYEDVEHIVITGDFNDADGKLANGAKILAKKLNSPTMLKTCCYDNGDAMKSNKYQFPGDYVLSTLQTNDTAIVLPDGTLSRKDAEKPGNDDGRSDHEPVLVKLVPPPSSAPASSADTPAKKKSTAKKKAPEVPASDSDDDIAEEPSAPEPDISEELSAPEKAEKFKLDDKQTTLRKKTLDQKIVKELKGVERAYRRKVKDGESAENKNTEPYKKGKGPCDDAQMDVSVWSKEAEEKPTLFAPKLVACADDVLNMHFRDSITGRVRLKSGDTITLLQKIDSGSTCLLKFRVEALVPIFTTAKQVREAYPEVLNNYAANELLVTLPNKERRKLPFDVYSYSEADLDEELVANSDIPFDVDGRRLFVNNTSATRRSDVFTVERKVDFDRPLEFAEMEEGQKLSWDVDLTERTKWFCVGKNQYVRNGGKESPRPRQLVFLAEKQGHAHFKGLLEKRAQPFITTFGMAEVDKFMKGVFSLPGTSSDPKEFTEKFNTECSEPPCVDYYVAVLETGAYSVGLDATGPFGIDAIRMVSLPSSASTMLQRMMRAFRYCKPRVGKVVPTILYRCVGGKTALSDCETYRIDRLSKSMNHLFGKAGLLDRFDDISLSRDVQERIETGERMALHGNFFDATYDQSMHTLGGVDGKAFESLLVWFKSLQSKCDEAAGAACQSPSLFCEERKGGVIVPRMSSNVCTDLSDQVAKFGLWVKKLNKEKVMALVESQAAYDAYDCLKSKGIVTVSEGQDTIHPPRISDVEDKLESCVAAKLVKLVEECRELVEESGQRQLLALAVLGQKIVEDSTRRVEQRLGNQVLILYRVLPAILMQLGIVLFGLGDTRYEGEERTFDALQKKVDSSWTAWYNWAVTLRVPETFKSFEQAYQHELEKKVPFKDFLHPWALFAAPLALQLNVAVQ